jgi:hypothetical protein
LGGGKSKASFAESSMVRAERAAPPKGSERGADPLRPHSP